MAKPILVAFADCPGASGSTSCRLQDSIQPSHRPRYRRHRSPKPPPSFSPSSGLLTLLASVVSASTVNGSPAPPSFLCPSLGAEAPEDSLLKKRSPSSPVTIPTPQPTNLLSPRAVPDRYHQDTDGVWRRVASYTLYGSTVSACTGQTCRQPTNVVTSVDDQLQVSDDLNSTNSSTSSTVSPTLPAYDIRDTLPPGWRPNPRGQSRTPLILSTSLVLALVICFFIMSCLFWRKKVKIRHRHGDVEAKAKKKKRSSKDEMLLAEKEYKSQQKIWARATARWKANIRITARLRRSKRFTTRLSQAHQSSVSQDLSHSRSAGYNSSIRSMSSRRSSISVIHDQVPEEENLSIPPTVPQEQPPPSPPVLQNNLPPAYQHGQAPPMTDTVDNAPEKLSPSSPTLDRERTTSQSSSLSAMAVTNDGQLVEFVPTPLHVAHVATDDKNLLARLADLASCPPVDDSQPAVGTSEAQGSAPAWHDEDIEDIAPELASNLGQSSNMMFPPPPSKEVLASSSFYDYPYAFDEMESLEGDGQPSAPPFEESASSPVSNGPHLLPSAPPLLEDDGNHDISPTAPEWDPISEEEEADSAEDRLAGQNHDRMDSQSPVCIPSPPTPTSTSPSSSHTSPTAPPLPPEGSRSVTLPGYQP